MSSEKADIPNRVTDNLEENLPLLIFWIFALTLFEFITEILFTIFYPERSEPRIDLDNITLLISVLILARSFGIIGERIKTVEFYTDQEEEN